MSYRNLQRTLLNIDAIGLRPFVDTLITTVSKPVIVPCEHKFDTDSPVAANRIKRLLYELLFFFPEHKKRVSIGVSGSIVVVKLLSKESRRGGHND